MLNHRLLQVLLSSACGCFGVTVNSRYCAKFTKLQSNAEQKNICCLLFVCIPLYFIFTCVPVNFGLNYITIILSNDFADRH